MDRAVAIGCECMQIFVGNPRQWRPVVYDRSDLAEFRRKRAGASLDPLFAHTPYLVNLAADGELHERSTRSLLHTLRVVAALEGAGAVTHIGSAAVPFPRAVARVAWAVRRALRASEGVAILLEGSAGATLGATFDELRALLDAVDGHPRVGICLDTAHLFAAGWDIRTRTGVGRMLDAFEQTIGLGRLRLLHLNDSRAPCGSRLDRHENIGQGTIGLRGFRAIVRESRLQGLPAIIETPGFDRAGLDRRNLDVLKTLRGKSGQDRLRPPTEVP